MAVDCTLPQYVCGGPNGECPATLKCLTTTVLPEVVYATLVFVGVVGVAMVIFAGFRFITSQADKKTIEGTQKILQYAIIGLAVVLFSFLFLNIIGAATGVTCIEPLNVLSKGLDACK